MGNNKCVVCSNSGPKGYWVFPSVKVNPFLLEKWLEALRIDKVPKPSARVCFRHFTVENIHFTDNSTYPSKGKRQYHVRRNVKLVQLQLHKKFTAQVLHCRSIHLKTFGSEIRKNCYILPIFAIKEFSQFFSSN